MKKNRTVQGIYLASVLAIVSGVTHFSSTFSAHAEEVNIIQLTAGETLELTTSTRSSGAEFSWILTKDRNFLSGQRTRFFQTRLAEIGTYTLDVSIQNPTNGENALHTFTLIVSDNIPGSLPAEGNLRSLPLRPILSIQPPAINNAIYLPPQGGLIKIDSSKSEGAIDTYGIDLDSTLDSDNDGNKTNDRDNAGTLSEKGGTPIYLYALPKQGQRSVTLSVQDLISTAPLSLDLPIIFSSEVPTTTSSSLPSGQSGQISIQQNNLTINVSIGEESSSWQGKQVLYEWNFGDRSRSLLSSPSHTYQSAGVYTITVAIRDISTAALLGSYSQTVQITDTSIASSSASSLASSPSNNEKDNAASGFSLWAIIKVLVIIFFLLGLALGLYAISTWIKKRTTSTIQQTLEKIEAKIVKPDHVDATIQKPMPIKMTKDTIDLVPKEATLAVSEKEKNQKEFVQEKRTMETPLSSTGPVPSWLKNAPDPLPPPAFKPQPKIEPATPKQTPAKQPDPAPKPSAVPIQAPEAKPVPSIPPTVPKETPPVQSPPTEKITTADGPTPAWLKPKQEEKVAPVAVPEKAVAPTPPTQPPRQLPVSGDIPKETTVKKEAPKKEEDSDPTIAIIKADSLS